MPRRLIIGILVVLILGIVGGTVVLIVQQFRGDEVATPTPTPGGLTPAQPGSQQVTNPSGDDDADGLTNAEEVLWGTITGNIDSDGDGYTDGEEVAANHNPTIPAPNDTLPANFQPGQNVQPLGEAPLQADQFFVDGLDVTPDGGNLTELYRNQYPEAQRTQETMVAFAKQQPIITNLPTVRADSITVTETNTTLTLGHYLDTAGNIDALINRIIMADIMQDLFVDDDPSTVLGQALAVKQHQQQLATLPVPPAAVELHRVLLGLTELLSVTYLQMGQWNEDPVTALVALNQLDTIDRKYMPLIQAEIGRLQQLSDSSAQ